MGNDKNILQLELIDPTKIIRVKPMLYSQVDIDDFCENPEKKNFFFPLRYFDYYRAKGVFNIHKIQLGHNQIKVTWYMNKEELEDLQAMLNMQIR